MKTTGILNSRATAVIIGVCLSVILAPSSHSATNTDEIIPVIQMENVDLNAAILNLARQAQINYILEPKLVNPDGELVPRAMITMRWQNKTAKHVLAEILEGHGLTMVENPATTVTRITYANQLPKPNAANLVAGGTNGVIPLIKMDMISIDAAIRNLASRAQLEIVLDRKLSRVSSGLGEDRTRPIEVSFHWENLTARQALAALLDNYDLNIAKDPTNSDYLITRKHQTVAKPTGAVK